MGFAMDGNCNHSDALGYCFLWPMEKVGNAIASVMRQNRVGSTFLNYASDSELYQLQFFSGEHKVLNFYYNRAENQIELGKEIGKRSGSR